MRCTLLIGEKLDVWILQVNFVGRKCYNFALFSKENDGPRRSNQVEEDDGLKQKKQIKVEHISRLMLRLVDYTID